VAASSKLVLVDGSALIYRAYYAIPGNLSTSTGTPTNATFGFATMFRKLFAGRKPEYGAVFFDPPGPTFRDEKYAEYKAGREAMPEVLRAQLPHIHRLVDAFRFPRHSIPGYEADDVIGTVARLAEARGMDVLIVSGDKDFAQVISDRVRMLDAMRDITYDPELVRKKWGVPPRQFVDLLALVGDKIDNIPGVPGIGQKGAASLLEKYGDLDGVIAHVEELKGRQKSALVAHADDARLSRELATIDVNVPLPFALDDLRLEPPNPAELNAVFKELEFYSLLSEDERIEAETTSDDARYEVVADAGALVNSLRATGGPVAVEPIYEPENVCVADWVGLAFSPEPGVAHYLSLDEGGALPPAVGDWLEDAEASKLVHNAKKLHILVRRAGRELRGVRGDTMLASFLIDPNKLLPHRLDQISKEFLHRTLRPRKRLVGSGQSQAHPRALPADEVASYVGHRADAIVSAWPALAERLEEEAQTGQLRERDLPLAAVLGDMELHGILVDREDLDQLGREFAEQVGQIESRVHAIAGRTFNLGSTKQLSQVLFEELKLPVIKRTKTGYSTASEVLERLAKDHEIAQLLLEHRKLTKLISTYTNVLRDAVMPSTGRIHADFQQTASQTGRLISTEPDLQRTPIRTPEGRRIRRAFIAPPGHRLVSADWSQIELRILAHVSGDELLRSSFREQVDVHRRTASQIFDVTPEEVTPEQRGVGKTINFATIYGQGATALGQIVGVPRKEAQAYINSYFEAYAGVRAWLDGAIERAYERGYAETIFGRRRYIPELHSNSFMEQQFGQRVAANTPIQGSAADLCKQAMLDIERRLRADGLEARMIMQIHDELVFEVPEPEVDAVSTLVQDAMEHVHPLDVPLVAEVGVGPTWSEAH
jgi:DNA polymerase-1